MPLSAAELRTEMKKVLRFFNDEGVPINDQTVHQDVLSDDDGPGGGSKAIYKLLMRRFIKRQTDDDPAWPTSWMEMTVADLSDALIEKLDA